MGSDALLSMSLEQMIPRIKAAGRGSQGRSDEQPIGTQLFLAWPTSLPDQAGAYWRSSASETEGGVS